MLVCLVIVWFKKNINSRYRISAVIISLSSIAWGIWSTYFMPYWGSHTMQYVFGKPYCESTNLCEKISSKDAISDIVFVRDKLRHIHPACTKTLPVNIQEQFGCSINELSKRDSVYLWEVYQHIQLSLSLLEDSHTKVLHISSNKRYLDLDGSFEILAVNDVPVDSIYEQKRNLVSSETLEWTKRSINNELRTYDGLVRMGLLDKGGVLLTYKDSINDIYTHYFSAPNFKPSNSSKSSMSSSRIGGYVLNDTTKTAYFRLDNCYYYSPKVRSHFDKGIDKMFASLVERDYKSLIIDLRGNPGGNTAIIHSLMRYMPIASYHTWRTQIRRGQLLINTRNKYQNIRKQTNIFTGDIFILTSLSTFSAAMMVADCMQGNGLAKIVGESPGNLPVSYGNIVHFLLPCSKLLLTISTSSFDRTDSSNHNKRLIPDIQCESNDALDVAKQNA